MRGKRWRIGETTGRFALVGEYWCGRCQDRQTSSRPPPRSGRSNRSTSVRSSPVTATSRPAGSCVSTPNRSLSARTSLRGNAAARNRCDHPVVRSEQSFVDVVREVTDDEGAAVVYKAIGKDTLQQSLDSLRPMGVCAAYGHVSCPPEPVDIIRDLGRRGSLRRR